MTTYFKKMIAYWELTQEGLTKDMLGFSGLRVLFLSPSQDRIDEMIRACKSVDQKKTGSKMFLFARTDVFSAMAHHHIFDHVWQNGHNQKLISIIE